MAPNTKDMRRPDLSTLLFLNACLSSLLLSPRSPQRGDLSSSICCLRLVPYQEPSVKGDVTDFSSTLSSTLPMAAMFMRNKFVGWIAVVFSIQTWLGESEDSQKSGGTPGYFSVGMSVMALAVTYLPLFIPPPGAKTTPPPPVPLQ
ncbi:uncharacterized protein YPR063C [Trichoderma asperellum]|uniref:Uncharacterized protein YPR063C n=1 Tax=Trichoderma asperellum TaxID=101201 RepID=A0A6V8QPQ7_TRIAP|nr:uncharacterized protein YPR063C [Trichoderma asperellum]